MINAVDEPENAEPIEFYDKELQEIKESLNEWRSQINIVRDYF